ncbi:MAG TPA: hypothetical protein VGV09_08655 [Steroidobacteraceae bacterium]|nr:hypothetical protein [Steroidobacteraceae bacterium]
MKSRGLWRGLGAGCALWLVLGSAAMAAPAYRHFKAAIYVSIDATQRLADPKVRDAEYLRISSQLKFDKVYLETYRSGRFVDEASLEAIKKFFQGHGIAVAGGVAFSAPERGGQFSTLDYEDPHDRDECRRAMELTARHFDEIILDDFFFFTSKSDADIAAKGQRSWTQYRLEKMREVSEDLVLKPAHAINPRVKVIVKYPNWYEHFQGLGYDLDVEAKSFDDIYTGTETRDPQITDQLLQQYESYLVFRYFDNVRPNGRNLGGWVDTYDIRYVDRYAEQLWETLFAKAPEITLFNWSALASPAPLVPGERPWSSQRTSLDWKALLAARPGIPQHGSPGWARAAGVALEQADQVVGELGKPMGVASYKPFQSSGEDYLHDYLGNLGIPIELTPVFPTEAPVVLLTESAKADPDIVAKIKRQLTSGKTVVITSGLLHALQGHGIEDIVELEYTGRKIGLRDFFGAYGAGRGVSLNAPGEASRALLFPEIRFYTNDAWPLIRGVAEARGVPVLLMERYSRGILYLLNIPDNPGDLYELPRPVTQAIRSYIQGNFPVRLDAPAQVSLFAYDNGAFIVESFRAEPASVEVSVLGAHRTLKDLMSGEVISAESAVGNTEARNPVLAPRTRFEMQVPPHSYRVLIAQ